MTREGIYGLYAAVLTPRNPDDSINVPAFRRSLEFLLHRGISSFVLNGATGEFCLTTARHLRTLLDVVREVGGSQTQFLCGVGAAGIARAIEYGKIAQQGGAQGLLLPMPYFFHYQQDDLEQFCRTVAHAVDMPFLLYNLPQFSSGLNKETVRRLILEVPNIIGIKDSSGLLDILRDLTEHRIQACRMVGSDSVLAPALSEGICDGVISGIASVLPELVQNIYALREQPASAEFRKCSQLLNQFIEQLDVFPAPWGLKWISEARGITQAVLAQPASERRSQQRREFVEWFLHSRATAISAAVVPGLSEPARPWNP